MFCSVLTIKSFLSLGSFLASRKDSIFLSTMSPSVLFLSSEDFKSAFVNGYTLLSTSPRVAIMEATTRYTRSFSLSPFSLLKMSLFSLTRLAVISSSLRSFSLSISSWESDNCLTFSINTEKCSFFKNERSVYSSTF